MPKQKKRARKGRVAGPTYRFTINMQQEKLIAELRALFEAVRTLNETTGRIEALIREKNETKHSAIHEDE